MADSNEIAQALAVVCLDQPNFVYMLIQGSVAKKPAAVKDAKLTGEAVGEFYQAIYKAVLEAPSKAAETSKS